MKAFFIKMNIENNLEKLNKIGIALSSEKNINNLLELIVDESMDITNSDGGTLYIKSDDNTRLSFKIIKNRSLNFNYGGIKGEKVPFYPVKLYDPKTNKPSVKNVSAYCALNGKTVNIKDVYEEEGFDFSGMKNVDMKNNYRSKSTLNVPLKDHENKVIGVLQLWNSIDSKTNEIIEFKDNQVKLIESLSSQAAVAYNNTKLIEYLEDLFKSLIQYTVKAIDQKTHHTAGHSSRVAKLTRKMAFEVSNMNTGIYKDVKYTSDELEEIWISGLMHDVGKIGTPERILDKRNKIDGAKFQLIEQRFKLIKSIIKLSNKNKIDSELSIIDQDLDFIKIINERGRIFDDEKPKLVEIYNKTFFDGFNDNNYLNDNEFECLNIEKGNLTIDERKVIQEHIVHTKTLLNKLKFPDKLKNVPLFAGAHHENYDGSGYPDGIVGEEIPLPARMMAIADIWDAVTAQDRPYRPPVTDDRACIIIKEEVKSGKLDGNLVDLYIEKEIWKTKK